MSAEPIMRLHGLKILAAEDVEVNRLVLEDMLQQQGAEAVYVGNGKEALSSFIESGGAFDVVLMDVQMPVMSGLEATRKILSQWPDTIVIGLTAHEMVTEQQHCFEAGMVAHVTKPVDELTLVETILCHVEHRDPVDDELLFEAATLHAGDLSRVIDWHALERRYAGREQFINRLVESALKSHEGVAGQLRQMADDGEADAIGEVAHGIKSMAGNLAANGVQQLAMQTETCALHGNASTNYVALELATMLEQLIDELKKHKPD